MTNLIDLLFLNLLNKLSFFSKLIKNSIILVISNTFLFSANYIITKNTI